jgi:hypothetical protein
MRPEGASMNRIPKAQPVTPSRDFSARTMCRTCAYRTPSSPEEREMSGWYFDESRYPHPCHERKSGVACVGAMLVCEEIAAERGVTLPWSRL